MTRNISTTCPAHAGAESLGTLYGIFSKLHDNKMSKGIDIHFVRENYRKLTDAELIQAATTDAVGLTPEALEVVKEEIARRKLDSNIIKGLEAQNKIYSIEEIDTYCDIVRKLACPTCGASDKLLNGTMTSEVISFILFTQRSKKLKVACPDCLAKANNDALAKTAVLGWWSIPWGPIRTIQAIVHNLKSKENIHSETPNNHLRSYTISRIGELETYKNDKDKLQQIISNE
jgi:hypothetical protein